jgi:hypothetical protein
MAAAAHCVLDGCLGLAALDRGEVKEFSSDDALTEYHGNVGVGSKVTGKAWRIFRGAAAERDFVRTRTAFIASACHAIHAAAAAVFRSRGHSPAVADTWIASLGLR